MALRHIKATLSAQYGKRGYRIDERGDIYVYGKAHDGTPAWHFLANIRDMADYEEKRKQ